MKNWKLTQEYNLFVAAIGVVLLTVSLVVLLGWHFQNLYLTSINPTWTPMKVNEALCFLLCGVTLLLFSKKNLTRTSFILISLISSIIITLGLIITYEFLFTVNFDFDQLGNMTFITASIFILLGCTLLLSLMKETLGGLRQTCTWFIFFIGLLSFYNYVYSADPTRTLALYITTSMPSAILFMVASLGLIFINPQNEIAETILKRSAAGYYLRRIIPIAFLVPLFLSVIENLLQIDNFINENLKDSFNSAATFVILCIVILFTARRMDRQEENLTNAQDKLLKNQIIFQELTENVMTDAKAEKKYLQTKNEILSLIEKDKTLIEVGPKILKLLCQTFDWDMGEMWLLDEPNQILRFVNGWHLDTEKLSKYEKESSRFTFTLGEGLPGKVWKDRKPLLIPDFSSHGECPRSKVAEIAELNSSLGIPIIFQDKFYGVMEFYSLRIPNPDEDALILMNSIAKWIGEFI